jgi:hypothetical protein
VNYAPKNNMIDCLVPEGNGKGYTGGRRYPRLPGGGVGGGGRGRRIRTRINIH